MMVTYRRGIFCGNYFSSRKGWRSCQKAWYVECYKPSPEDRNPMWLPLDEDGRLMVGKEGENRCGTVCPGDHLF
jgi:hypothetical protein